MKSSVLMALLLRDGTAQSRALELRKVALVLCFSAGNQPPFMYYTDRSQGIVGRDPQWLLEEFFHCDLHHLQSGGVAAQIRRVDKTEAEDSDAATVEVLDVAKSTVLQVC